MPRLYEPGEGRAVNGSPRKPGGTKSLFVSIKQSDIGSGLSVYDSNKKPGWEPRSFLFSPLKKPSAVC